MWIKKFYAWKLARSRNVEPACMEVRLLRPENIAVCAMKIAADALVHIAFRADAGPATKMAEILYDRVIKLSPRP